MGEFDALEALAAGLDGPVAGQIHTAVDYCRAPIVVQVAGRAGVGRRSVAAALGLSPETVTTPVDAIGSADPVLDADVVVYVVVGGPHPADEPEGERTLLVRNKIDLTDTGAVGLPMVATLALATARHEVTSADLTSFGALAGSRDATLLLAEALFHSAEADVGADARAALLHRWSLAGVAVAVAALRRDPGLDAGRLRRMLRAASGVDAVARELATRVEAARVARSDALYADLAAIVARTGCEPVERFLELAAHV